MGDRVELNSVVIKTLASDVRVNVLKSLDRRNKTLSELSRELDLSKPTLLGHLRVLIDAGLIDRSNRSGSKWVYYSLTSDAKEVLRPSEKTKIILLLTISVLSLTGSVLGIYRYSIGRWIETPAEIVPVPKPVPMPPTEVPKEILLIRDPLDLAIGIGLLIIAMASMYYLLKGERRMTLKLIFRGFFKYNR